VETLASGGSAGQQTCTGSPPGIGDAKTDAAAEPGVVYSRPRRPIHPPDMPAETSRHRQWTNAAAVRDSDAGRGSAPRQQAEPGGR